MSRGNWLNPLSQLIMSMSFQTSNSGAFRSLHCLIYKVLAPFRVRCGTFTILPQAFRFVKYFFRLFSKSFFVPGSPELAARKLGYLTTSPLLCQVLFSILFKIFFVLNRCRAFRSRAWLLYHSFLLLSSPFFAFHKTFFQSPGTHAPLGDSSPNISYSRPLVNTFFPVFSCFFQRLAKTFSLIRDIVYEEHPSTTYGTYII